MQGVDFKESTDVLGRPPSTKEEDVYALPVTQGLYPAPSGDHFPTVVSCFEPTDEEREAIANGANVYLHVMGTTMPPVLLSLRIEAALPPAEHLSPKKPPERV